jgi:hypothetical protein
MKEIVVTRPGIILLMLLALSCSKKDQDKIIDTTVHPYGEGKGKEVFWASAMNGAYPITVTIKKDGVIRKKDSIPYHSPIATCDHFPDGFAFVDTVGDYTYSGISKSGQKWEGQFTLFADNCHTAELQGDSSCPYQLATGNWVKQTDGYQANSKGLIVSFDGSNGTVVFAPSGCCFKTGDLLWNLYSFSNCSINYFSTDPDCKNFHNNESDIRFNNGKDIYIGNDEYKQQ